MIQCEFILFIKDQQRSREFYRTILQRDPELDVPGMIEFNLFPNCKLGLLQQENAARILKYMIPDSKDVHDSPRCELYLTVDDPAAFITNAAKAGAVKISDPARRNWGDIVAYCSDPDGHIIAFAKKESENNA